MVCDFADTTPLVIGVDDVHYADPQSARLLSYLIRRIRRHRIMVILTESSGHQRELSTLHAETLHLPFCHQIRLGPLAPTGIVEVLTGQLGTSAAERLSASVMDITGGNPCCCTRSSRTTGPMARSRRYPNRAPLSGRPCCAVCVGPSPRCPWWPWRSPSSVSPPPRC
ncbi:hypothetical protein ACFQX7_01855 [Luedemannella flava]